MAAPPGIALVTGGGSGIGAATARTLVEAGWSVVICGRDAGKLAAVADPLGASCATAVADVTDFEAVEDAVAACVAAFGPPTALVNNAGVMPVRAIRDVGIADWRLAIEVNVIGALNAIAAVLPGMIERGGGDIVNVGSVGSLAILPQRMAYSASKHAVRAVTEALRVELADTIRAIEINPGATSSDLLAASNDDETRGAVEAGQGDPLPAQAVADAIVWALSRPPDQTISEITIRPKGQSV